MLSAASSASSMDALRITAPDLVVTLPAWIAAFAACEVRAGKSAMRWRPIADREQRRQAHRARGAEATCDEQRVHSHEVARDDQLREQSGHEDDVRGRDHESLKVKCSQNLPIFTPLRVAFLQGLSQSVSQLFHGPAPPGAAKKSANPYVEFRYGTRSRCALRDTQTDLDSHWSEGRTEGRS